jgi:hypothetical protein
VRADLSGMGDADGELEKIGRLESDSKAEGMPVNASGQIGRAGPRFP